MLFGMLSLQLLDLQSPVQTLHIDLTDALRASHHVRGVHSLVCRNHHELLHPVFHAQVCDDLRTVYIILHSLRGVVLHHRHMLVGGSMEHIVGPELPEDLLHPVFLADTCHDGLSRNLRILILHHQTDIMLRRLCLVDQEQGSRSEIGDLTHHLTADRACRPRNQHTLAFQELFHRLHVDTDFRAGQQLFDAHLFQLQLTIVIRTHLLIPGKIQFLGILGHQNLGTGTDDDILDFLIVPEIINPVW